MTKKESVNGDKARRRRRKESEQNYSEECKRKKTSRLPTTEIHSSICIILYIVI